MIIQGFPVYPSYKGAWVLNDISLQPAAYGSLGYQNYYMNPASDLGYGRRRSGRKSAGRRKRSGKRSGRKSADRRKRSRK